MFNAVVKRQSTKTVPYPGLEAKSSNPNAQKPCHTVVPAEGSGAYSSTLNFKPKTWQEILGDVTFNSLDEDATRNPTSSTPKPETILLEGFCIPRGVRRESMLPRKREAQGVQLGLGGFATASIGVLQGYYTASIRFP